MSVLDIENILNGPTEVKWKRGQVWEGCKKLHYNWLNYWLNPGFVSLSKQLKYIKEKNPCINLNTGSTWVFSLYFTPIKCEKDKFMKSLGIDFRKSN